MCDFDNNRWPRANIHFKQGGIYQRITVESHLLLVSPRSILVSSYVDFYKKGKKKENGREILWRIVVDAGQGFILQIRWHLAANGANKHTICAM
jgi:hypothetical protein